MTNLEKLYLFLSYSNQTYDDLAPSLYDNFKKQNSYKYYLKRVEKAKELGTKKADEVVEQQKLLEIVPSSMEQYFVTISRFYYLSTLAFERYYLNPLAFEGHNINIKSIGDILIPFDNHLASINNIIEINGYTDEYKMKCVKNAVGEYEKDALNYINVPIKKVRSSSSSKYMLSKEALSLYYAKTAFFIIINVFLLILFFVPGIKEVWKTPFYGGTINIVSWWMLILIILYDYVHVFFYSYFKMICEPYYYTKRYSLLKESDLNRMAEKAGNKLKNHLELAIRNKVLLKDDIKLFSSITENKVDLYSLEKINKKINSKSYKRLAVLNNIFFFLVLLAIIAYILFLIFNSRYNSSGVM